MAPFKSMLDQRIKPGQPWAELIHPILLTYKNKLVPAATGLTTKEAIKQEHALNAYANLKLKAKQSRKYPAISGGGIVHLYTKKSS